VIQTKWTKDEGT